MMRNRIINGMRQTPMEPKEKPVDVDELSKRGIDRERNLIAIMLVVSVLAILALVLFFVASCARADDFISWTHPTFREDGTLLSLAEIKETKIRYREYDTDPWTVIVVPGVTSNVTIPRNDLIPSTRCYCAATIDTLNQSSRWTAQICKTNPDNLARPGSPTALKVS